MRLVLGTSPDDELDWGDMIRFDDELAALYAKYSVGDWSLEQCQDWIKSFTFRIGEQTFGPHEEGVINDRLVADNTGWILQGGYYGTKLEFVLGRGERLAVGDDLSAKMDADYRRV